MSVHEQIVYILIMFAIQRPKFYPDSIEFWLPVSQEFQDNFFAHQSDKAVLSMEKDPITGEMVTVWIKERAEHKASWWGTMIITPKNLVEGKGGSQHIKKYCISFYFSVHKWHFITNGINGGSFDENYLLAPIREVFSKYDFGCYTFDRFRQEVILRRIDISTNMRINGGEVRPVDYIRNLANVPLNRQEMPKMYENNSLAWFSTGSNYRTIVYDKHLEQKKYFTERKVGQTPDIFVKKNELWKKKFDKMTSNVIRFEVQFGTAFIRSIKMLDAYGVENMNNIIDLARKKTEEIIEHLLGSIANNMAQDGTTPKERLSVLEEALEYSDFSETKKANAWRFALRCERYGYMKVKAEIGSTLFCRNKQFLKRHFGYDVTLYSCPIISIGETSGERIADNYEFLKNNFIDRGQFIAHKFTLTPCAEMPLREAVG